MAIDYENIFTDALPGDNEISERRRQVFDACYSFAPTSHCSNPELHCISNAAAESIGMPIDDLKTDEWVNILSGNQPISGTRPYAMCYGGHQFGHWAGQLGDGRAINIAEFYYNEQPYVLQLKGAGRTPYSRNADGRAVLRSSIREFVCSEAMHFLGVPTTRALSLVTTGDLVMRDVMYDGNPAYEPGAIVCRMAPSFIRFGNFEIFASRGDLVTIKKLLDYTITQYFKHLMPLSKECYIAFIKEVATRTCSLIIQWLRVGFTHGVMNTDNMSILGLTIDYGPYGWLEEVDLNWTPNTTDNSEKRYAFGNQANIALWNVIQLINALYPLIEEKEAMTSIIEDFRKQFSYEYMQMMHKKVGIQNPNVESIQLINKLLDIMSKCNLDFTIFFRNLAQINRHSNLEKIPQYIIDAQYQSDISNNDELLDWLHNYQNIVGKEKMADEERLSSMNKTNPKYIFRNYMAYLVNEAMDNGDDTLLHYFMKMIEKPYEDNEEFDRWFVKRPSWADDKIGCSSLSCSS